MENRSALSLLIIGALISFVVSTIFAAVFVPNDGFYAKKGLLKPSIITELGGNKKNPIMRLSTKQGGFFCTGFVISDEYAITAAHCVERGQKVLVDDELAAEVVGYDRRVDYALLQADFKGYQKLMANLVDPRFPGVASLPAIACGYPGGQHKVVCTQQQIISAHNFFITAKGELMPGMSGGPLLVPGDALGLTVTAIGVNSFVGKDDGNDSSPDLYDLTNFSNLLGFSGRMGIE